MKRDMRFRIKSFRVKFNVLNKRVLRVYFVLDFEF